MNQPIAKSMLLGGLFAGLAAVSLSAAAFQMYPDGSYGPSGDYHMHPDGSYGPGHNSYIRPDGSYGSTTDYEMTPSGGYVDRPSTDPWGNRNGMSPWP